MVRDQRRDGLLQQTDRLGPFSPRHGPGDGRGHGSRRHHGTAQPFDGLSRRRPRLVGLRRTRPAVLAAALSQTRIIEALAAFSRKLSAASTEDDVLWATATQVHSMYGGKTILLAPEGVSFSLEPPGRRTNSPIPAR